MTWVKICGLTDASDVAAAVGAGADAVGFVNIRSSPRYVTRARVAQLSAGVPVHTVLLTLDVSPDRVIDALEATGVRGVQPYGRHALATAQAAVAAGYLVLYPIAASDEVALTDVPGIPLLDTPSGTALGGTGKSFDWSLVADIDDRFVLAGGLGPGNVAAAVAEVGPWGVDASSGLEQTPGRKDHSMVADFISKAKKQ